MTLTNARVLVQGGGIAGTALAYWLHRAGARPTVVERADAIRAAGYKVDIRGAALTVVERMGVLDQLRALRTDVRHGSVVDARGRRVASLDADTFGGRTHGDAEVLRGDLNRVLFELTAGTVDYRFGESVTGLVDTGDGVKVTFASGATESFDLVIGADGLRSPIRGLAFADADPVRHLNHYVSIFSVPNHLGLDREELTYVGPGRTTLVYSTAGQSDAKAMFLWASDPLEYDPRDRAAQQRLLADAYAGEGWEVPTLLKHLDQAKDFYFDALAQVHLDGWSRGRVGLVGDAAYGASPASGQGTSLALVGAYVLAGELKSDPTQGFAAYEQKMREFVRRNQALGPANVKRMVMRTERQVRMSMRMLSIMGKLPGRDRMLSAVMAPLHKAANAIDLPNYDA
ncbi:FAD-dependent monooxygenase [Virgisporangium aurantiacum]|uniref:FAD-dependent oxidoreductase n=1 Tax=Virgisporangium aurantiacum TaxID=175570 RepID=A0A8J3Z083_9ACTN|nr:FAD-dependent monooxygenase [Virgisporangium aurantiacum]GIJ55021.1 FAD-dependent oxidoreductase [Virgisporangium aurantiacum]